MTARAHNGLIFDLITYAPCNRSGLLFQSAFEVMHYFGAPEDTFNGPFACEHRL